VLAPAIIDQCTLVQQVVHDVNKAVIGCFMERQPTAVVSRIHRVTLVLKTTSDTHACLTGARKVKPIWILLKQETVSGSGISWAICKSAPRSRQITTPAPHHSDKMPFLTPNQQHQSTEETRKNIR